MCSSQIKAIKLVTGVTPTCWRPPYGDVDVSCAVIFLRPARYRHILRVQDRIRAVARALDLQTIVWKYDSFDWEAGPDVDGNYQLFINNLTAGNFNKVGGILLTHELNDFTMEKAIEWYPRLKSHFSV